MRHLTDDEYNNLSVYAYMRGMSLHGYTVNGDTIILNNSIHDGVSGETIEELRLAISRFAPRKI